ncbi:hypothetical protein DEO72_LG2g4493 [Vigna unguiculata]|uniref:Uncharacterized protein n=1 Tax=Vigna unguiculata TaxID=3917 RepID=A0A4D6L6M1_VIGUN|nr:hypothetical protein DEO72_LG2g4493 [Vigna unguiculata]
MWSLRYQSQSEGVVSEDAVGSALKTRWSYRVFALKKRWVRVRGFDVGDVLIFPSEGVVVGDQLKKQGRYRVEVVALQC